MSANLKVDELLASLPADLESEVAPQAALRELAQQLWNKPVPTGAWRRLWVLGGLQARIALAYLAYFIRASYSTRDAQEQALNEAHLSAALRVLGAMSYLRGALMKVGQTMAAYPHVLPDQFIEALGKLHSEAPPMHYALVREQIYNELGGEPEDLFAEFEPRAFAAASLGQVHRAKLKSGELVAVKVQYPNIARTIATDMRNVSAMLLPMRLSRLWDNLKEQIEDVRCMLELETDYVREAGFLRRAREVFEPGEGIVVPRVFEPFSTRRVLTMEYLEGVHLDRFLDDQPSQAERDRFGWLIMLASFRIAHKAGFWYADSNPGNYVFMRDGRLGVIDFGCCRQFTEEEWEWYKAVPRSYDEGPQAHQRVLMRMAAMDPDKPFDEAHVRFLREYHDWFMIPLRHEGMFDFGDEAYMRRGLEHVTEVARKRYFQSKPMNIWLSRQLIGLRALAYKLKARVDMKAINEQESKGVFFD